MPNGWPGRDMWKKVNKTFEINKFKILFQWLCRGKHIPMTPTEDKMKLHL